jgi:hypothetical protein
LAIKKWGRFGKIMFILKNSGGVLVEKTGILVKSGGVLVESGGVLTCIYYIHIYFFGLDFNSKSFFFFI